VGNSRRWWVASVAVLLMSCGQDGQADVASGGMRPVDPDDEIAVTDIEYRARRAGELPPPGPSSVGDVALPAGHLIEVDPTYVAYPEKLAPGPLAWVTDEPVANPGALWNDLATRFPDTGLWPLVLEPLWDGRRWWDDAIDSTLSRQAHELDGVDAESTLAGWWSDNLPSAEDLAEPEFAALVDESLTPFGREFPGLAPPPPGQRQHETTMPAWAGHLGLVAVERPADAPVAMGWTGPINYYNDAGPLTVVLRSWEYRYDTVVVGLGFDTLLALARRPPQTEDAANALAAEHYAACPDLVLQGAETIERYASTLRGEAVWTFWWD
jgi:hypothetical protein